MNSKKIYLFRHGELIEEYNNKYVGHLDVPLSSVGVKQAQRINEFIKKVRDSIIITSDLQRTFSEIEGDISKNKDIREINFGKWDGLSWNEIEKSFMEESRQFIKNPEQFTFPLGESFSQLSVRVISQFDKLLEENKNLIFIVHAGVIRAILSNKLKIPLGKTFDFKIDYAKCTIIEKSNDHFSLLTLNSDVCSTS